MFLGLTVPSDGQQIINGSRTLLGNWDASGAATTKPVKAGTAIPASCGIGEIFFKTDANPGANLYLCTTGNTWTQVQGGGSNFSQISGTATAGQLPASIQYFSSGTGAPGGVCTAGQNAYLDTTNLDYWFCDATNAWKKVLSTTSTGPFALTGQTGTAPSTPAAGFTTVYLSSADKTLHTVSDAGVDMRYAGLGEANTWGAYVQDFSGSTVRLPVAAGFTTATNGAIGYDSTANRLHTSISLTDSIIPNVGTTPPVTGNCVKWGSNYQLQDNGAACGGGSTVTSVSGTVPINVANGTSTPAITYTCLNNSGDSWISGWGQQPVLGNNSAFTTAAGTGGANPTNVEELRRVWFCGGVVNKIVYEVTTAQATGTGHWSWGLYNSAGTIVLSTGQLGLSSGTACSSPTIIGTGVNTVTSSSTNCGTAAVGIGTNIPAGYYYEATVADTTTAQFRALTLTTAEYGGSGLLQTPNIMWGKITGTSNGVLVSSPTLPPTAVDNAAIPTVVLVN